MRRFITHFLSDESGATAIEYSLIAALIAVVIIAAATNVGTSIHNLFDAISVCITTPAACTLD